MSSYVLCEGAFFFFLYVKEIFACGLHLISVTSADF